MLLSDDYKDFLRFGEVKYSAKVFGWDAVNHGHFFERFSEEAEDASTLHAR